MYIRWHLGVDDSFGVVVNEDLVIGYVENVYQLKPTIISLASLDGRYQEIVFDKYYDLLHQHVILMIKEICRKESK